MFLLLIGLITASGCFAGELLPPFGEIPKPEKGWILREKGKADNSPWSWVIYTNAANSDVLSYAGRRMEPGEKKDLVRLTDTAHEIFPGGLPAWSSEPKPNFTNWSLRYGVTKLGLINARTKRDFSQEALEVSFVQVPE